MVDSAHRRSATNPELRDVYDSVLSTLNEECEAGAPCDFPGLETGAAPTATGPG